MRRSPAPAQAPRARLALAVVLSLLVHLGVLVAMTLSGGPAMTFDVELVTDLEFGQTAGLAALPSGAVPATPSAPAPATAPPSAAESGPPDEAAWANRKPDAALPDEDAPPDAAPKPDAKAPDAGPVAVADAAPASSPPSVAAAASSAPGSAGAPDGGPPASAPPSATGLAAARPDGAPGVPAGAQLALRLDLGLIRASPLAEEVRGLLAAIPDWRRILDGSGVDPVASLDRVLIASPTLRQDRMVLAGQIAPGQPHLVANAVVALSRARGLRPAEWSVAAGVPVARWDGPDDVVRHVALLGERHFLVGRLEDLPAVVALAQARAARALADDPGAAAVAPAGASTAPPTAAPGSAPGSAPGAVPGEAAMAATVSGPDALLWLPPQTVVSGDVEGARNLVRGATTLVPERLRLALVAETGDRVSLEIEAEYPRPDEAQRALALALEQRSRALGDPLTLVALQMMGLATPLMSLTIEVRDETHLYGRGGLTYAQIQGLLIYLRTNLEARFPKAPPPGSAPGAPPSAPTSRAPRKRR